jgi:hypothetical protein
MPVYPHLSHNIEKGPEGVGEIQAVLNRRLSPSAPGLAFNEALGPDQLLLQNDETGYQILPHHPTRLKIKGSKSITENQFSGTKRPAPPSHNSPEKKV